MLLKKYDISRDDTFCKAFPDVALTTTGKLICVFLKCTHHGDRSYTNIMQCESCDRGRTWTDDRALTEACVNSSYWVNCPRIQRLQDGRMVVVVDRVYGAELTGRNYVVCYFSSDEGLTWSDPVETPCEGIVPDKICETSTGRWLLSAHYRSETTGQLAQRLWYSDDKGGSWSSPVVVASRKGFDFCEVSILQVGDKLVGLLRENSGLGLDCYKVISGDNGETWSEAIPFPLPGCHRPVAGRLSDGRFLITYRFSQGGKGWLGKWTQNFFAAITDGPSLLAKTRNEAWTRIRPVDFDCSNESDIGYSGWVQLDNGEVYIVNYMVGTAQKAYICGYAMRPAQFFDPPQIHSPIYANGNTGEPLIRKILVNSKGS